MSKATLFVNRYGSIYIFANIMQRLETVIIDDKETVLYFTSSTTCKNRSVSVNM
jgi:hypothetical protein